MGEAIVGGLLRAELAQIQDLAVVEPVSERRQALGLAHQGIYLSATPDSRLTDCEALILAVKPQDFPKAAKSLQPVLRTDQLVISIMAGIRIATLTNELGHQCVVRVMPNTPAALGAGFSAWMPTDEVTPAQRDLTRKVLSALGQEAEFHEERYLDMATAISGSGPAYVFLFLEAYINAAVHIGMPRPQATEMVLQTVLGSVEMAQTTGQHLAALRDNVTSPGGTTTDAVHVLEQAGLRSAMTAAVQAAYDKSRSLGG
jgi:pyrroline-5-carboxylate reductase